MSAPPTSPEASAITAGMSLRQWRGISAALLAPMFLGMAPVLGKFALIGGADPFAVAAVRTVIAAALLWLFYLLFHRRGLMIYPAGLLGCVVIGVVNGVGSLFYYSGLSLLDASIVQLINGLYLVFAVMLTWAQGFQQDRRTLLRVFLAFTAVVFIAGFNSSSLEPMGIGLMLGSALMFAATLVLGQYVLYEVPATTFTLYMLTTMAVTVLFAWLAITPAVDLTRLGGDALLPIIILGVTTVLSRLTMFAGVKFMGAMQTAMLAILEIGVALVLSATFLGDSLTLGQWAGVFLLLLSLLLVRMTDIRLEGINPNLLLVANQASVQFQRIAFHRAFGSDSEDSEDGIMQQVTPEELRAIQRMMGARTGRIDPFPIGEAHRIMPNTTEPPI